MKAIKNTLVCAAMGVALSTLALADDTVSFGLFGDMPYTGQVAGALASYQRLIADMNSHNLAFGVHIGDIKAGNTACTDDVYSSNLGLFNTFVSPIIYTPGDNEWTDCHRTNNGSLDPLGRLALIRSTFFSAPQTLGLYPKGLAQQPGYPENVRFISDRILVVTVNMPGSNNNRQQIISEVLSSGLPRANPYYVTCPSLTGGPCGDWEYEARNAANLQWLNEVMSFAASQPAIQLVVVAFQASPWDRRFLEAPSTSNANTYTQSGYEDFINLLRAKTLELANVGKQVIAVHGDTHTATVSTQSLRTTFPGCQARVTPGDPCVPVPYTISAAGTPIPNFTRIEVYAQGAIHWIKVTMNKQSGIFSIEPRQVEGNGTIPALMSVPAPTFP